MMLYEKKIPFTHVDHHVDYDTGDCGLSDP
jgi:hypothetical protein